MILYPVLRYGYWMTYFLFLESAEPGCGPLDRDDIYTR